MTSTTAYIHRTDIEIVERTFADLPYRVSVCNADVAGFEHFHDACEYANAQIGVTPTGSPRQGWVKEWAPDNGGHDYWTFQG